MKKLLMILVLGLFFGGVASADEFGKNEYYYTSYSWGFNKDGSKTIFVEITRYHSTQSYLFTKLIISNCKTKNILETISIPFTDGRVEPYEIKKLKLKTTINKLENSEDICSVLRFREGLFHNLTPDPCINEKNDVGKQFCKLKNKVSEWFENDKLSRSQAAEICANKSGGKAAEIRSQFYKDCMKEQGY